MSKKKNKDPELSFTEEEYRKYVTRENKNDLINDLIKYQDELDLPFKFDLGNENELKYALDVMIKAGDTCRFKHVNEFKDKLRRE